MLERALTPRVLWHLERFPAVAVVGPRQAGKTTLARAIGGTYFDLEQPGDRTRLDIEWDRICADTTVVVLDEAQSWPEVFPRLRGAIDAQRARCGRFLLLGSVSPALMTQVSESLAGRLAVVELMPFTVGEIPSTNLMDHWLRGGYPDGGILDPTRFPDWHSSYLTLLAQRDLPNWGLPAKPQTIDRLLRMTAATHGQALNLSRLGQSLDLSHTTVGNYLDYLEGAFLVRRLRPYATNLSKRLVRTPKLYWRDSGLLHSLLRVHTLDDLFNQPWVGASWEGFVIEQIQATAAIAGRRVDPYFFRTSDGYEIDLLLDMGSERWAIEIKLTSAPDPHDLERLDRAADLVRARKRVLVSQTHESVSSERRVSCDVAHALAMIRNAT